jgi:hypothetical protein
MAIKIVTIVMKKQNSDSNNKKANNARVTILWIETKKTFDKIYAYKLATFHMIS